MSKASLPEKTYGHKKISGIHVRYGGTSGKARGKNIANRCHKRKSWMFLVKTCM